MTAWVTPQETPGSDGERRARMSQRTPKYSYDARRERQRQEPRAQNAIPGERNTVVSELDVSCTGCPAESPGECRQRTLRSALGIRIVVLLKPACRWLRPPPTTRQAHFCRLTCTPSEPRPSGRKSPPSSRGRGASPTPATAARRAAWPSGQGRTWPAHSPRSLSGPGAGTRQ